MLTRRSDDLAGDPEAEIALVARLDSAGVGTRVDFGGELHGGSADRLRARHVRGAFALAAREGSGQSHEGAGRENRARAPPGLRNSGSQCCRRVHIGPHCLGMAEESALLKVSSPNLSE